MLHKLLAIIRRDMAQTASYRLSALFRILSVLVPLAGFFFLSRVLGEVFVPSLAPYGGDYFEFALVGLVVTTYVSLALSSFASSVRNAQLSGTLEALLLTRTPLSVMLLGSWLYSFMVATLHLAIYLALSILLFPVELGGGNFLAALLALVLTVTSVSGLGLLSASFILAFKQGDPVNYMVSTASFLLSGVLYPVAVLPRWLQELSYLLPLTHSLEAVRMALLQGQSVSQVSEQLVALAAFTVVTLPLGLASLRYATRRARVEGSLAHY